METVKKRYGNSIIEMRPIGIMIDPKGRRWNGFITKSAFDAQVARFEPCSDNPNTRAIFRSTWGSMSNIIANGWKYGNH